MANEAKCPHCQSTSLTAQKQGFSGAKALGGVLLTGGIGALAGTHGSSKIIITCLNCGANFTPEQKASAEQTMAMRIIMDKKKAGQELTAEEKQVEKAYNIKMTIGLITFIVAGFLIWYFLF